MLILTELRGDREPQEHRFRTATIRIGRVPGNDLVIPVKHISSRHAKVRLQNGSYLASDLGSTNGSFIERQGERLLLGNSGSSELELKDGDYLVLGDVDDPVRLKVDIDQQEEMQSLESTIVASRNQADSSKKLEGIADDQMLRTMFHLVSEINEAPDRKTVLDKVTRIALEATEGAVDALIVRSDQGRPVVLSQAHRGTGITADPNTKICEHVAETGQALLFGQQSNIVPAATLVAQGLGSGIAAPLWADNELIGVLQVNCETGKMDLGESHLDLTVVLAHHAASALQKADLIERLQAAERQLREENSYLRKRAQPSIEMVGESAPMKKVKKELERAATSDVTVLLNGETGTGKEVAALYLHAHSRRSDKLLVPVNCGALTETLLDSELFGHKKGAFTGATSDRKGVFEMANGGTVFLDEVGEMPLALQVRLLRVLEEGRIKRVGEATERPVNIRIVAATNRDLAKMVEDGRFRQDLYYRLRVFPVNLPALRERPEDIEPLTHVFVRRFADQLGKRIGEVEPSLYSALKQYSFPGNVRELVNEIERAVVRADDGGTLNADLLSEELLSENAGTPSEGSEPRTLREQLAAHEREIILRTLGQMDGKKVATATQLGLTRQGLAKKMDRLGISK